MGSEAQDLRVVWLLTTSVLFWPCCRRDLSALAAMRRAHWHSTETAGLVRLAALIAADACTASLRWPVDLAYTTGVDDEAVLGALLAAASAAGSAQLVSSARRLALALGFDLELEGWDGS